MAQQREYQTFVRQMRAVERAAKRDRLQASREGRTLEIGRFGRAIAQGKGINLIEYGAETKYTAQELKRLDTRRRRVERQFELSGVTINAILAQVRPYPTYSPTSDKRSSDVAKARRLPRPDFVSQKKDILNFRVRSENPDPKRGIAHYMTSIRLLDLEKSLRITPDKNGKYLPNVKAAIKGGVQIDCQCGRYRYWYRYKSTVAGAAIKPERGFPKIRNPKLLGIACGHIIVTLNYLKSSQILHKLLADRFAKLADRPFVRKQEEFATGKEEKKQRKARVDRKLTKIDKAKADRRRDQRIEKRQAASEERRTQAEQRQAQREERRQAREQSKQRAEDKKKFDQQQKDIQALQRKLKAEENKRKTAEKKLQDSQAEQDRELVRQIVKTLRQAGLTDDQIKANEVVRASKMDISQIK